jgi:hypothetical protein
MQEGIRLHDGKAIEWVDDQLPHLAQLKARGELFDLILLTAVWMHLDEEERRQSMVSLASLLNVSGRISMSLRYGPVPQGRRMFNVSADETIALAATLGISFVHCVEREDMLSRPDVRWSFVVLEKR